MTGFAGANDFPTTPGAFDQSHNGRNDVYVTKFNPSGSALAYSTFIRGSQLHTGSAIAIDRDSEAYVTALTASESFPTTTVPSTGATAARERRLRCEALQDASTLAYSTLLEARSDSALGSPSMTEQVGARDRSTSSSDYPTPARRVHDTSYAQRDAFVTKLTGPLALAYSSYLADRQHAAPRSPSRARQRSPRDRSTASRTSRSRRRRLPESQRGDTPS